jgi:hypothetical protein
MLNISFGSAKESTLSSLKILAILMLFYTLIVSPILMYVWSDEPEVFNVKQITEQMSKDKGVPIVSGSHIMAATIHMSEVLLNKTGGFLSNDIIFPSIVMDNIPRWEFGVVEIERVVALALRSEFSRSQSQSIEIPELVKAQTQYNNDSDVWVFPSAEDKYRQATENFKLYMRDMADSNSSEVQFYSRADNLANLLNEFSSKLGSLSSLLGASTQQGSIRENIDLANDATATQSTKNSSVLKVKTDWAKIDDVFYEARGQSWAILHILKAVKYDFEDVLSKKNAHPSLNQIIRDLEDTQTPVGAIVIMNADNFGTFANHSLVMANYISRANAALINMVDLLRKG